MVKLFAHFKRSYCPCLYNFLLRLGTTNILGVDPPLNLTTMKSKNEVEYSEFLEYFDMELFLKGHESVYIDSILPCETHRPFK